MVMTKPLDVLGYDCRLGNI